MRNLVLAGLFLGCFGWLSGCSSSGGSSGGAAASGGVGATGVGGTGNSGGINLGGSGGINVGGAAGGGATAGFTGDPKTCGEAQQARTYIGCDFWPTVTANAVWSIFDYAVVVANYGDAPADIAIDRNGSPAGGGTVQPKGLEKFYLPWVPELKGPDADANGVPTPLATTVRSPGGAYHLTSTLPVVVYQFNALEYKGQGGPTGKSWGGCPNPGGVGCFSYSNDASLLLPTTALTNNYRVTGPHGWGAANIGSYFAVTGTQDNTSVTVLLGLGGQVAAGGGVSAGSPGSVIQFPINRGEVVQVMGTANGDFAGTLVQSSAPVQVIAGISCIYIPDGSPACDHIEESVFPAETLGAHYFVAPPTGPNGDTPGHVVRLYGDKDGTTLTYPSGGPPGAPNSLGAGQVVDLGIISQPFEVVSQDKDHEFAVSSFQLGGSVVDPSAPITQQRGDPAMSMMTAVEQFRTNYVFLAPDDYDISYVDVTMPDGANVTLDGSPLSAPTQSLGGGYSLARASLGPGINGAHNLVADKAVGIQVVGYGFYTSYQYPGGLNLTLIAPPPPPIK
jgi:IgGFc binding protein